MKKLLVISLVVLSVLAHAQGGGGGRGGMRGGGNNMTSLLSRSDVQSELKLSDDQKAKLAELMPQRGARGAGGAAGTGAGAGGGRGTAGGAGGQNVDPAARQAQMAEREKNILAVLTPEQAKRLEELYVQRVGNRAITRAEIQKKLGLTDDQVSKIKDLVTKSREAQTELMQKVQAQEIDRTEMQAIMQKNNATLDEELGKVLTADQASKLKSMRGAEFKFEENGIR